MTQFTVRVELHDADWDDYENLNEQLSRDGFEQSVKSRDGMIYHLPAGEYSYNGDISRSDVLDKAIAAAQRTGKDFSVLVTKSAGRTWYGLH